MRIYTAPDGVVVTGTVDEILAGMFGPPQHDAHAKAWHRIARLRRWEAEQPARLAEMRRIGEEWFAEVREQSDQRVAKDYGYNTASLRRELHRWELGCFSKEDPELRARRIRQLRRALDIAIEHHNPTLEAAE